MTFDESERLLVEHEARYMDDLRAKLGDSLKPAVLGVMAGLYRSGWRDCRYVTAKMEGVE